MECWSFKTLTKIFEKRFSVVKLLDKTSRRKQKNLCDLELGNNFFFNRTQKNERKKKSISWISSN